MTTLYAPRLDAETFLLEEVIVGKDTAPRRRALRGGDLLNAWIRAGPDVVGAFLLVYAVVQAGERRQRPAICRKIDPRKRNVQLGVATVEQYLSQFIEGAAPREPKSARENMKIELNEKLTEALRGIRADIGFGSAQASQHTYQVTEDAVAATSDPALQRTLRHYVTLGDLSDFKLQQLQDFLEKDHPQDSAAVLKVVKATQSREHLSALSLHSIEEKLQVTIVNAQGQRLTLPEHKFRDLLTHPDSARLLHTYTWGDQKSKKVDFVFSGDTNGKVVGCLTTAACRLDVVRVDEKTLAHYDRARFVLDLDYICCVYVVLHRIRADRERFDRLLEQAEASFPFNPFAEGFPPYSP